MKKDTRVNLKVNKITRDRLMALKYAMAFKNMDELFNSLIDHYGDKDMVMVNE